MPYVSIIAGLVLLVAGGELLIRYASRLAVAAGISPLVVGLTIVAFGTSAPEVITSVYANLAGEGALAVGNVVGSNIINVLLILGLSALAAPLAVDSKLLRVEVPAVLVVSGGAALFAASGSIARWEAGLLFATIVVYTVWAIVQSRRESAEVVDEYDEATPDQTERGYHWSISVGLVVVGLGLLVFGARIFVGGATEIAQAWGVSESIIGLTIVAAGTSLPELATSVLASLRGQRDIAVGNVVGSNLFNLTGALGLTGLVGAGGLEVMPSVLKFDFLVMIATAVVCLPVMFTGRRIDRWEGGVFVLYYVAYVAYLVLEASAPEHVPTYTDAIYWFLVPLTLLTLAVIAHRERGSEGAER